MNKNLDHKDEAQSARKFDIPAVQLENTKEQSDYYADFKGKKQANVSKNMGNNNISKLT